MATTSSNELRLSLLSPLVPSQEGQPATIHSAKGADWGRVIDELLRLRSLPADWDGQGSLPLDPANVDQAITWVKDMRRWPRALPPTAAVPGTSGEVILEWRGQEYYLAAEMHDGARLEWLLRFPGQPVKQWDTDLRSTWIVCAENGSQE